MSPHTDAGALLKLADRLRNFAVWNARQSHYEPVPLCREAAEAIEAVARQAASHGRAGGEPLDEVYKRAWDAYVEFSMAPDHTTFDCIRAVVDVALSPPVPKTGEEAEASNGGTTYSPIGRNADGIEVYKRDAIPVDAGAREVLEKVRRLDWSSNPGCSALRAEVDAILALPKLTAAGERDRYKVDDPWCRPGAAQAVPMLADIEQIISEGWRNGKSSAEVAGEILREFGASAQAPPVPGFVKPDTERQVFFYEQDFYVLSNFSAFRLDWSGLIFDTSEAAYHYEKFAGTVYENIGREIRNAHSAHAAFKLAEIHKDKRRPDWDEVKVDVMRNILRAKVEQHEYVRRKLLATGDRELIEDSWRDSFWGWGPGRYGQNMLGKLWMEVRAELRASSVPSAECK